MAGRWVADHLVRRVLAAMRGLAWGFLGRHRLLAGGLVVGRPSVVGRTNVGQPQLLVPRRVRRYGRLEFRLEFATVGRPSGRDRRSARALAERLHVQRAAVATRATCTATLPNGALLQLHPVRGRVLRGRCRFMGGACRAHECCGGWLHVRLTVGHVQHDGRVVQLLRLPTPAPRHVLPWLQRLLHRSGALWRLLLWLFLWKWLLRGWLLRAAQ